MPPPVFHVKQQCSPGLKEYKRYSYYASCSGKNGVFGIALITEPAGCKRPSPWYRKALDSFLVLVIFPSLLISGTGRVSRETVAAPLFHLAPAPIRSVIASSVRGAWCVVL